MEDDTTGHPIPSAVVAALAEYLHQADRGRGDFEAFCAERPEIAGALRELYGSWCKIAGLLSGAPTSDKARLRGSLLETVARSGDEQGVDSLPWRPSLEFWHVLSGAEPELRDGRYVVSEETGVVLVLVPGGTVWIGSQGNEVEGPNYEPGSTEPEQPPFQVELAPYFLSKYELTQGQWIRATDSNPSAYPAGADFRGLGTLNRTHPVENVTWWECDRVLRRQGLAIPTEAQLERALRAGTTTAYYSGPEFSSLQQNVNSYGNADGYLAHAPVDEYGPNPNMSSMPDVTDRSGSCCTCELCASCAQLASSVKLPARMASRAAPSSPPVAPRSGRCIVLIS